MGDFIAALPWWPGAAVPVRRRGVSIRLPALEWAAVAVAYLAIALLLRGFTFGSPTIHVDEQFYLLVGDRMLHGALPYVDIWDRKPIGLFLLYTGIRLLGGEGFIQYQLVAMLFAAGTSLIVYRLAREIATNAGAWWAGVGYLLYLSAFNCFGGQATLLYNPLVALAALMLYQAWTAPDGNRLVGRGLIAMALIGLALQIKYTVVFEGVAFGLAFMLRGWAEGWRIRRLLLTSLAWCIMALAPTALAYGAYAMMGHGHEFFFANFVSIFGRQGDAGAAYARLGKEMAALIPFWLAIFVAPRHLAFPVAKAGDGTPQGLNLLRYWGVAAFAGFFLFGTWYDHYTTALLAPLCVLAAPALGRMKGEGRFRWRMTAWLHFTGDARMYTALFAGFGIVAAGFMTITQMHKNGTRDQVEHVAHLLHSRMGSGCAYIYEGAPSLYLLTGSCFVTPYIFPNHLNGADDAYGLGIDAAGEVSRIMASHPQTVMIASLPTAKPTNWQNRSIVLAALARDYSRYAVATVGNHEFQLFSLKHAESSPAPGAR